VRGVGLSDICIAMSGRRQTTTFSPPSLFIALTLKVTPRPTEGGKNKKGSGGEERRTVFSAGGQTEWEGFFVVFGRSIEEKVSLGEDLPADDCARSPPLFTSSLTFAAPWRGGPLARIA